MKLFIGTSGFGYAEWAGKFYPKGLKPEERLAYYASRFNATEINSTFYALPKRALIKRWLKQVPKDFSFSYKAPGRITHMKRLKNAGPELKRFLKIIGDGLVVFQLPPSFKKDIPRLAAFLKLLPKGRFAFEFRNPTWFDQETFSLLQTRRIALCLNDADVEGCPLIATAPWGVLKLRRVRYTPRQLAAWARKIHAQPWKEAYVFFKHEDTASGPKLAARLAQECGKLRAVRPA
jgi:uncharacterized protein YecE (DUF72 family)